MRTNCSICSTVLILRERSCVQMLSSMPQRTCRPMAMAIMFSGRTLSMEVSRVSIGAIRAGADEVGQVVDVRRIEAAADGHPGQDQRHVAGATAHVALDRFELGDVGQLEVRLDAVGGQAPDVLLDPGRTGGNGHFAVGGITLWGAQAGAGQRRPDICSTTFIWFAVDGDGHLVGLRRQFGEHVAGVVGQPLGDFAIAFRAKEIEPPTCRIMSGTRARMPAISSLNLDRRLEPFAVEFANVNVNDRGAGVVAIRPPSGSGLPW